MQPQCPYCQHELAKMPGRKTKCPECKNPILVRTHPHTDDKVLLREDQLAEHEALWGEVCLAKEWRRTLKIGDAEWNRAVQTATSKFGHAPMNAEVVWQCMNGRIPNTRDLHDLQMLYFQMARFLYEEGKDPRQMLLQKHTTDLKRFQQEGLTSKVRIQEGTDQDCPACRKLAGGPDAPASGSCSDTRLAG